MKKLTKDQLKKKDAIELVKLLNTHPELTNLFAELLGAGLRLDAELAQKMAKILLDEESLTSLYDSMAVNYINVLSVKELKGVLKFYRSPIGKIFVKKTPDILRGNVQVGKDWANVTMAKHEQELTKIMVEAGLEKSPILPEQVITDVEADKQTKLAAIRWKFSQDYIRTKGWDMGKLTYEQLKEIRDQDGWKNAEKEIK